MTMNYQKDFYRWTEEQASLLKAGRLSELDSEHLIEELESMGASELNQLQNRLKALIAHLLKWQYQPSFRSRSWHATIEEQRLSLLGLIEDSPSLKNILDDRLLKAYPQGVLLAVKETNLDKKSFPATCPYTVRQLFDIDFYPE
jgi:hypothetical protein